MDKRKVHWHEEVERVPVTVMACTYTGAASSVTDQQSPIQQSAEVTLQSSFDTWSSTAHTQETPQQQQQQQHSQHMPLTPAEEQRLKTLESSANMHTLSDIEERGRLRERAELGKPQRVWSCGKGGGSASSGTTWSPKSSQQCIPKTSPTQPPSIRPWLPPHLLLDLSLIHI